MQLTLLLLLFFFCLGHVRAQFASATNFWPSAYPLAVRSAYLNTWLRVSNGSTTLFQNWPQHWDLTNINGWSGWIRVDGKPFVWLGNPDNANSTEAATVQSSQVTPTRTTFISTAGPVSLNITFISPIEPADLVKQSLPFTYLSVSVQSTDGNSHSIQLYSDISAEWISGNRSNVAQWNTTQTASSVYHQAFLQSPQPMQEIANLAEDSTVYYGMKLGSGVTWQSGQDITVRNQFAQNGKLTETSDIDFRPINQNFVVFGLATDLGTITQTSSPVVWSLGLVRDPVIQYTSPTGTQSLSSYFWTQYSSISDAIDDFIQGFADAASRSAALDSKILSAAQSTSSDYADIVSLGARQAMTMDFTISRTANGGFNTSDVKAFLRDTGGERVRGVNTVTTLYAAMPSLLYVNATWLGMLLSPLLEYQSSSSLYTNQFAAPDLGGGYPVASGNSATDGSQGVEDTGDMLIMTWAYTNYTGVGDLASIYYDLFKEWADYLTSNSLNPTSQQVDGLTNPNMTNLAIKGILGIRAFASIAKALDQVTDANAYFETAQNLTQQWLTEAFLNNELRSTYSPTSPVALIYNLYADTLLNFGLVENSVYSAQTSFYQSQVGQAPRFGLPFDGTTSIVKSHWTMFTAAGIGITSGLRNTFVSSVRARANFNTTSTNAAFPTEYDDSTGNIQSGSSGQASPQQGGLFAILALGLPTASSITIPPRPSSSPGSSSSSSSKVNAGAIAGGVIGGIVGLLLIVGLAIFLYRRRNRDGDDYDNQIPVPYTPAQTSEVVAEPFVGRVPVMPPDSSSGSGSTPSRSVEKARRGGGVIGAARLGTQQRQGWDSTEESSSGRMSMATTSRSGGQSSAATTDLRNEVDNLRREMAEIRAQREYDMQPPPLYGQ